MRWARTDYQRVVPLPLKAGRNSTVPPTPKEDKVSMGICHVAIQTVGQALWKHRVVILGSHRSERLCSWEIDVCPNVMPPGKHYIVVKTLRLSEFFLECAVAGTLRHGLDKLAARVHEGLTDSKVFGWHDNSTIMTCVPSRATLLYTGRRADEAAAGGGTPLSIRPG